MNVTLWSGNPYSSEGFAKNEQFKLREFVIVRKYGEAKRKWAKEKKPKDEIRYFWTFKILLSVVMSRKTD